jgi:hypothetical protein
VKFDTPDLAGRAQRLEGAGDLVGVHQPVGAMHQQQVEVVGAQLGQRAVDRGQDVRRARVVAVRAVRRAARRHQLDADLADQLDALAQPRLQRERLAEQAFDAVAAVDVGMVEAGHAELDALLDPAQALLRRPFPRGQAPGAGDDGRQRRAARSEFDPLHRGAPYTLKRKFITSPSFTTYSLPSARILPASFAPCSPLKAR